VTEFHTDKDDNREPVSTIISEHPDSVSLQPVVRPNEQSNFSLLTNAPDAHSVEIERMIWFGNTPPTAQADVDRTFYATNNNARLEGYQYAVIGPGGAGAGARTNQTLRQGIPVGWRSDDNVDQLQRIRIEGAVSFNGTANDSTPNIKPAIGIPVASKPGAVKSSAGAWAATDRVGFSISEPLFSDATHYYPNPTDVNPATNLTEAYGAEGDDAKKFRDRPLDSDPDKPDMPLQKRDMLRTGTYSNVRTVFLQRLANPMLPHNPDTNPYITVDWMPMDLTVFNGEDKKPDDSMLDDWDPDDPDPEGKTVHFNTRTRGKISTARNGNTDYNIWTPVTEDPDETRPTKPDQNYFRHALRHSLGHLNASYGQPQAAPGGQNGAVYLGGPEKPFPWIRWANRPFIGALELMEVPASTPARLLLEFSYIDQQTTSPYDNSPDPNPYKRRFNHLLNFFHATDATGNQPGGDFYRIFEFLHVPSPFVGTETMLDPRIFQTPDTSQGNPPPGAGGFGTENLHAPFNWVSNYREPGKLNLNTMNSPDVGNALRGASALPDFVSSKPSDPTIASSRRGGRMGTGVNIAEPVPGLPSIVPFPFRSPAGGDMVPDLSGNTQLRTKGVHVSLLRQGPQGRGQQAATPEPLFADPSLDAHGRNDYANSDRNPAFRYAALERLGNLTTTRSNVFAIWITVGYFEVFPNASGVDAGHPDGYQIGAELGSDTGEIVRHRGFYIIDRTIPVGFERGYNHNVDRAILLKRFIE
jgi:hypothetical protein